MVQTTTFTFTITATPPATQDFSVDWAASKEPGDSADETTDFTATSGTESFITDDPNQTFDC